jgi:hypothetical protein
VGPRNDHAEQEPVRYPFETMAQTKSTTAIYKDVILATSQSFLRAPLVLIALIAGALGLIILPTVTGRLGIIGGFIVGFYHAAAVGTYLYLVGIAVTTKKRVTPKMITNNLGALLWEVISVLFLFMIAGFILHGQPEKIQTGFTLLLTLIFNPVPELIYLKQSRSMDLLRDATLFMQRHWPEWLGGHLLAVGVLGAWALLVGGSDLTVITAMMQMFGPWFGFIKAPIIALSVTNSSWVSSLSALFILLFAHGFMIFRGHLFLRLSRRR